MKTVKLKDISINNRGYYGIGASAVDYDENKFTYLRITDINDDGSLNKNGLMSVDDEKSDQYLLEKNDIVFARTGASTGRNYFYEGEINKIVYAGFLIKFSLNPELVNPKFIKYYCLSQKYKDWISSSLTGSTRPNINEKQLSEMPIELPDRFYQDKVVEILDSISHEIQLNNETNNNLFELVLNDFNDFLDKNTDAETVKLEDCVEKINTGADAIQRAPIVDYDTGIRCIRIGDMTNGRDYHSWGFTKMTDKDFENYKLIRNDIVITRTAVNGLTYMITDEEKTVCNNGNIRLRVNNKYNPLYIYLNTKTKDFRNYIDRINSETSVRPNMKVEYFTSFEIKKIDLEKQNNFCLRAESIMKKIQNNKVENYNLEQLRDILLPKLMNGEIDLDNIEI